MSKYLHTKPGSIEELAAKMTSQVSESDYQQQFKKELEKAGKGIGAMTPAEKKAFFNKIDAKFKAKNEAVDNPYAVGMAQAMKKTGDKPPLKKSTITKAHDIAKSIKKDEMKEETLDEGVLEKILKISKSNQPEDVKDAKGRVIKKLTPKGAEKFLKSLKDPLTGKSIFDRLPKSKGPTGWLSDYNKSGYGVITKGQTEKQLIDKLKSFREEVEETHSFVSNKQNQKQKDAKGEKDVVDPEPKLKKESDAYDNDRFEIRNGIAYIDNKNTPDNKNHVYAPDKATAVKLYKQGKKVYREEVEANVIEANTGSVDEESQENKDQMTFSFHVESAENFHADYHGLNEQTAKQHSLMKAIYSVWSNSATELEEVKHKSKYMKASKDDVSTEVDAEQEKKEQSSKDKDKDGKNDQLEKENERLIGQVNILRTKLENEKNKAIKPEPNPETGEVPLTVGVAYKHLKDKMKKESDDKEEQKKNKTMTDKAKTPVDTKPEVDYKH